MYVKAWKTVSGIPVAEDYTEITNLSFAPAADLVGASMPINEFEVDIRTTDTIELGAYAELYDDSNTLWASYWVIYSEHVDVQTLRLRCQSDIALLERVKLPAVYYSGETVKNVLDETIVSNSGAVGIVVTMPYTLDNSFNSATVTGFCPEQTARERLLWVCFTIGAYVKTYWNTQIEILPIDSTETLIPMGDVYWKPTVTYNDWVTALRCKAYTFTQGTPQTTDTYVKDANGTYYIVTETEVTLSNTAAPAAAPENVIDIDGVYLINNDNVSGIMTHLSQWYFKRMEVDFDCINNGAYKPGDKVLSYTDDQHMVSGFINSASFTFGLQSKATIHLTAAEDREANNLTILYKYNGLQIGKRVYCFPVGYAYSVTNPYIDMVMNGHRYVFRPTTAAVTGTMASGGATVTVNYAIALDLFDNILDIISVDDLSQTDGVVTIE